MASLLFGGLIECLATSAVGEKNKLGTVEKFLGRPPRSFISCEEATGGFCLKSERGVYDTLPRAPPGPSYLANLLLMDHDVRIRHAIITTATNAITAPTIMNTKPSGKSVFCMYGAFCVGGTEGGG